MRPHARIFAEVSLVDSCTACVAENSHGLRRKRIHTDQIPFTVPPQSFRRHDPHVHAKTDALALASVRRHQGIAKHKAADNVRPARYRLNPDPLELLFDPVVLGIVKNRPGGLNRMQLAELANPLRRQPELLQSMQIGGAGTEHRHLFTIEHAQERILCWKRGRTIEKHDLGAAGERAQLPVPHHPAR